MADEEKNEKLLDINKILLSSNIAEELSDEELSEIGSFVFDGYKVDKKSRAAWEESVEQWTKLALQHSEKRNYPWPKAANTKFPVLSTAAMQFAARAYPALVPPNGQLVNTKVIGADPDGEKLKRASRVSKHMSYQLMVEMEDWEEEMDKMLVILPIVGTCFKKTYWDSNKQRNCSSLVLPQDLVVNYWAKTLETAERKTEIIEMSSRVLKERQLSGTYLDIELPEPSLTPIMQDSEGGGSGGLTPPVKADETTPYRILEQHTYYDLDGDGYAEPYVITIEETSKKVLRMVRRFEESGIVYDEEKKNIIRIEPTEYYTKFPFIPNPDGGFYDVGFGLLLGSINETINTSLNQLIDAGTLSNLQSGFISKSLRMKMGEMRFQPGEWKAVNATGDALKNGVLPLPVREPSAVVLNLMQMLVGSSKELASVAEIFVGKMPGQNTPATTTMASIDQGMKLFTAIYKRIYRALQKEYTKLYRLNAIYLEPQKEIAVLDEPIQKTDYETTSFDIMPAADPTAFSQTQKLMKAQGLAEMLPLGTLNPMKVTERILDAQEQPNWQELIMPPQPKGPSPEEVKAQMDQQAALQKAQLEQQKAQAKMENDARKAELDQMTKQAQAAMAAQEKQMEMQHRARMAELEAAIAQIKANQDLKYNAAKHAQDLQNAKEKQALAAQKPDKKTK